VIFTVLTTTHSEVASGKYVTIPETIQKILPAEEGARLFAYSNDKDSELYISLKQLEIPLGIAMICGPNEPNDIGEIASAFGRKGLNIVAFNSFGIGKSGMVEVVVQEYHSASVSQPPATRSKEESSAEESPRFIGDFSAVIEDLRTRDYKVYSQDLLRVLPDLPSMPSIPVPIHVTRHLGTNLLNLRIDSLAMNQLKLEEQKEYHVLLTYYMRFPLLVIKFIARPSGFVQIRAQVMHKPNVLGPICESVGNLVKLCNGSVIFNIPHNAKNQTKAWVDLYGELKSGVSKRDVEQALLTVNEKEKEELLIANTIHICLITEVGGL